MVLELAHLSRQLHALRNSRKQLQNIDVNHRARIDPQTGRFFDLFGIEKNHSFGDDPPSPPERAPVAQPGSVAD